MNIKQLAVMWYAVLTIAGILFIASVNNPILIVGGIIILAGMFVYTFKPHPADKRKLLMIVGIPISTLTIIGITIGIVSYSLESQSNKARREAVSYYNLGLSYYKSGLYDKAVAELQKAVELNPQHITYLYYLGESYYRQGKYNKALIQFEEGIKLKRDDVLLHNGLGNVYSSMKLYDKAIDEYKAAIGLSSYKDKTLHGNLAGAYSAKGLHWQSSIEYEKAELYTKALKECEIGLQQSEDDKFTKILFEVQLKSLKPHISPIDWNAVAKSYSVETETVESTKPNGGVDIGDGFSVSNVNFNSRSGHLKVVGQITNNSQRDYSYPSFDIRLYNSNGIFLGGGKIRILGTLLSKKTRTFEVSFYDIPGDTKVGKYEVQFAGR